MQGTLLKKGQGAVGANSGQKRHFECDASTRALRYYKGAPPGAELKGEVVVRGIDPRDDLQGAARHKPHRFDFLLDDDTGRRPVLAASAADRATRQRWIAAVMAALAGWAALCVYLMLVGPAPAAHPRGAARRIAARDGGVRHGPRQEATPLGVRMRVRVRVMIWVAVWARV